ncbi:DUF998 domain-containing protein [Actinoplanes sp. CA-015351]|uniref:DUF998 domain-containing protein n=1 Tax=Actinoplanes sp. CA-015351 TaxID=3239897 RepID=UPI003D989233
MAVLLIVAALVYFAGETVAVAAWSGPGYSLVGDHISDLGVPGPDSPLAWAMNGAFVVNAVLVFLAVRDRCVFRGLTLAYCAGLILIAVFHTGSSLHGLGAFLAIAGGNAAIVMIRRFRFLGVTGLVGFAAFVAFPGDYSGLLERIAVYPILVTQFVAGLILLRLGPRAWSGAREPRL